MGYIRLDEQPGEVYHYTHRKNLDSILRDGRIRRMGDRECWFCASLEDIAVVYGRWDQVQELRKMPTNRMN